MRQEAFIPRKLSSLQVDILTGLPDHYSMNVIQVPNNFRNKLIKSIESLE